MDQIVIRGARQHNLKNIDLTLPRNKFIVITGVSGSGKSSLAFDTLFAEGHRRYVEALSSYARQFLQRLDAPQVDEIQGLSPSIAIEQKGLPRNPRSTVGTLTDIHDHLRLLYARLGTVYCSTCNRPVRAYTVSQVIQEISHDWPDRSRLLILAPLGVMSEKEIPKILKRLRRDGFARFRLDGKTYELDPPPPLPRRTSYSMEIIVDRLILSADKTGRLMDSLELASKMGNGVMGVAQVEGEERFFSERFQCLSCRRIFPEPTPSLFSSHHPSGMCPTCKGLGFIEEHPPEDATREKNAPSLSSKGFRRSTRNVELTAPDYPLSTFDIPFIENLCPDCHGSRLNEAARSVRLGDLGIHEVASLSVPAVREWLDRLRRSPSESRIADRPMHEITLRLNNIEQLGLSYLTLGRSAHTLSGGEAQRLRLAHQISSPLSGILYVLDEPSVGLHPHDHQRLLQILFLLRETGNTVVVVEHDEQTILQADYVVDMGPGAGSQGGEVIFAGSPADLVQDPFSLTGLYLSGRRSIRVPGQRRTASHGFLEVSGATGHNLKGISVRFPLECLTCVTGVSGSGKSTLVLHTLYRALVRQLHGAKTKPAPFRHIDGADAVDKVILIDQSPLGRTPRSTPSTFTGIFASVRALFSQLPEARARGYGPSRFSFNVKGGRCEICKGEGLQRIEMFFLPDVYVTCPDCQGKRYGRETLEILFKGRSISDVLGMTVNEASIFFENLPSVRHKLEMMMEVGLGYLRLGQPATTLSGGEAQRVKLASELSRRAAMKTLYILDEPTTGLHFDDIQKLLHVLQRLADLGHTVIMIEHHPDVIKTADYVIDLGPEGGEKGGYVVAAGTPEAVALVESSLTGRFLRKVLKAHPPIDR